MESSRAVVLLALSNCMYDCDGRLQKLASCISGNQWIQWFVDCRKLVFKYLIKYLNTI